MPNNDNDAIHRHNSWSGLHWPLLVLLYCTAAAGLITLLVPDSGFWLNLLHSCGYGFPVFYVGRGLSALFPRLPSGGALAAATPVGVLIGSAFGVFVLDVGPAEVDPLVRFGRYLATGAVFSLAAVLIFYTRGRLLAARAALQAELLERNRQERLLAESRLRSLQAQIEPHFLFNTLATVQALIDADPKAAKRMLERFTELLRHTLQRSRDGATTLGQELEIVEAYLDIQQLRLGERLRYRIEVPECLRALPLAPLLLQPLVENAVGHGIEPSREGGELILRAEAQAGRLRLCITDTGRGFGHTSAGNGIGLKNVRERLQSLYGDEAALSLAENAPHGVAATLEVPLAALA